MKIAGIQKLSLIDFPGHVASIVFLQGCNFTCGYCQNPELIGAGEEPFFPEEELFDYLTRRSKMLEGVVVTGGEPVIHKDLPEFLKRIKDMGFKIKLDTNGSDPDMIEHLLREHILDYIAIDLKTAPHKYHELTGIKNIEELLQRTIRWTMLSAIPYEFRTTCVPGIVDEEDILVMGRLVRGARRFCLQQYRSLVTYDPKFLDVKPYDPDTLRRFQNTLSHFVREAVIRGI